MGRNPPRLFWLCCEIRNHINCIKHAASAHEERAAQPNAGHEFRLRTGTRAADVVRMSMHLTPDPASEPQWRLLLGQAEALTGYVLDRDTGDYLVQLLIRTATQPRLLSGLLALDRLTQQAAGASRLAHLRDIGDQCLLFAGLFPHEAAERNVRVSHFISLGRTAYRQADDLLGQSSVFGQICDGFVALLELLHAMRELGEGCVRLTPLHAFELWDDTGSDRALRYIRSFTSAIPVRSPAGESLPPM